MALFLLNFINAVSKRKVRNLEIAGVSGRGRPRKNWEQVISEDLRVKGLQREVAQN